jgi:hypothetical protein
MPKKKAREIVRPLIANPSRKTDARTRPIPIETAAPLKETPRPALVVDLSQFPVAFENKAGHYELIRVDGGQAYYSFTNHHEKTVDATMSVITWRKMQERALALKETA